MFELRVDASGDYSSIIIDSQINILTAVAELFWRGCKILRQEVRILPSHFTVTCYPYKEVHVTAKCDGKILTTCHLFCTLSKIVWPRQCLAG